MPGPGGLGSVKGQEVRLFVDRPAIWTRLSLLLTYLLNCLWSLDKSP